VGRMTAQKPVLLVAPERAVRGVSDRMQEALPAVEFGPRMWVQVDPCFFMAALRSSRPDLLLPAPIAILFLLTSSPPAVPPMTSSGPMIKWYYDKTIQFRSRQSIKLASACHSPRGSRAPRFIRNSRPVKIRQAAVVSNPFAFERLTPSRQLGDRLHTESRAQNSNGLSMKIVPEKADLYCLLARCLVSFSLLNTNAQIASL